MITFSWDLGHLQGPFLDILVCLLVLLGFCPGDHFGHLLVCEYFSLHFVRGICGFILWSHFADLFCGLDCVASSWGLVLFVASILWSRFARVILSLVRPLNN